MPDRFRRDAPSHGVGWEPGQAECRWLSYTDLAEAAGIKRESAVRLVRRKRWPKRESNFRGEIRVAVPEDVLEKLATRKEARAQSQPAALAPPEPVELHEPQATVLEPTGEMIPVLRSTLTRLISELERQQTRAEAAEARAALAEAAAEDAWRAGDQDRAMGAKERVRLAEQITALTFQIAEFRRAPLPAAPPLPPPSPRGLMARLLGR